MFVLVSDIVPEDFLSKLVILPVAAKWKELGIQLQVPIHKLNEFQANNSGHPDSSQRCLSDMFIWWLNNLRPTLETLAKALHSLQIRDTESLLCPAYGKKTGRIRQT